MSVAENLEKILQEIPSHVQLCAISKTKPISAIQIALAAGQVHFGENKVQEMTEKEAQLPKEIRWHQVGTLQRNKVKYIAPFVHLIHSIDSLKLLKEVHKEGQKANKEIGVLMQMHIAEEDTKFGLNEAELYEILKSDTLNELTHTRIHGLMGMATFTENDGQVAREFRGLKHLFDKVKSDFSGHDRLDINTLSMGMSGDYRIAIEEGSNLIRVGSAIFGERNY